MVKVEGGRMKILVEGDISPKEIREALGKLYKTNFVSKLKITEFAASSREMPAPIPEYNRDLTLPNIRRKINEIIMYMCD